MGSERLRLWTEWTKALKAVTVAIVALVAVEAAFASAARMRRSSLPLPLHASEYDRRAAVQVSDSLQNKCQHLAVSRFNQFRSNSVPLGYLRLRGEAAD
eukprot:6178521-Pleurochrysis_carterae.AAC.2